MQTGYPAPSHGRLTREQQEAEDHRLAMQLQEEEERSAGNGSGAGSQARAPPMPVAQRKQPAAAPQRTANPPPSSSADADYQMALRLAGDTPQAYPERGSGTGPRQTSAPRAPIQATSVTPPPERKLTREEQEAEDHRLAMELQQLEERSAGAPPGTAAAASTVGRGAHASNHPDVVAVSSDAYPAPTAPALHEAHPSSGGGRPASNDLFSTVHRPGHVGAASAQPAPAQAPAAAQSQPKRDIMDDLFSTPAPTTAAAQKPAQPPQPQQGGAFDPFAAPAAPVAPQPAQPQSKPNDFDFFGSPQGGAPAATTQPASRAAPASTVTTEKDLMDDLFAAAPAGGQQPPQQQPRPNQGGIGTDGMSHLDNFAAGRGNRAW